MENLFFASIAIVAFTLFSGCNNEHDDRGVKNEFTYNGVTYNLANGYLDYLDSNGNGTHDWDVYLASPGVTIPGTGVLTGEGDFIYLDLNNTSTTGLVTGTYNWSSTQTDFSIVPGSEAATDYNFTTNTGTILSATAGTVNIAVDGTETSLTFSLTFADGKTLTGEWEGVLEAI